MFEVRPLTDQTWADLEELFDLPGGSIVRGCWCIYYRKVGKVSVSQASGSSNKQQFHALVRSGVVPGLVGYADGSPVGWISLGPREDYRKLERSRIMKPVDDTPVWSIVCTYVAKAHRGLGVQHRLLEAAIGYARGESVRTLEAYPVEKPERSHDDFMFFGSRSLYERAGFTESSADHPPSRHAAQVARFAAGWPYLSRARASRAATDLAAHAACMREHGVPDFPDPSADGIDLSDTGIDEESPAFKEALRACQQLDPPSQVASPAESVSGSAAVWQELLPGAKCGCSDGSQFSFLVHEGDPRRVLVYLEGDGARSSAELCDPANDVYRVRAERPAPYPSEIFDFGDERNPF